MYKGKTIYSTLAFKSILEKFKKEKDYRRKCQGEEELKVKKACFVSLHMRSGELRGCIGTLEPYRENLMEEIIGNAKSAAFGDPRFPKVAQKELENIEISVDVLDAPEKIVDKTYLNPKVYGLIVVKGGRRGVLLPDLPGVDGVEDQIHIAMEKAGIYTDEDMELYRFKVKRYY